MGFNKRKNSNQYDSDDEYDQNNVCCGLICTKSISIIFNFVFIVSFTCKLFQNLISVLKSD